MRREKDLRKELENLMTREEIMWAQKARSDWIVQGDRNAKYFQTIIKQRRVRNRILQIKTADGSTTEDMNVIENTLVDHFRKQYEEAKTKPIQGLMKELETLPIPKIDTQQQSHLDSPLFDAEIEMAVYQLGPHKALGPDGIPAFFYQKYWDIVRQDILNSVHAFFHLGSLFPLSVISLPWSLRLVSLRRSHTSNPLAFAMLLTKLSPKSW